MCALALAAEEPAPSEHSAAISRGRQIYSTGVPGNGAPLTASVGDPPMDVPASILKCSNCHGSDGRGKAEGGVAPANIRGEELSKPANSGPAGRRRNAYTSKLLVRAISLGIDASGNRLDPAMPRYRLTHEQAADLVAYLEVLGREADPGVTETALKIGVILPPASGAGSPRGIREVIAAFAVQVNEQGGFYGRQLQFAFINAPAEVEARAGAIRDFVEAEQPFVLISSYVMGCEEEIGRYLDETDLRDTVMSSIWWQGWPARAKRWPASRRSARS
jgi:mono/diheme cytochrome c family protein